MSAPSFDCTGKTVTFADACYINLFAFCENVNFDFVTYIVSGIIFESEFLEVSFVGNSGFCKVAFERFVQRFVFAI